jgi:hypothetical protein
MLKAALAKNSIRVTFNKNGKAVPLKFPKKKKVAAYTRIYLKSDLLFTNIAGKAGSKIYAYLRWQTGMNGKGYYAITNDFLEQYKITRQTKYAALKKLKKEGLIDILDRSESKGGNLKVRLLINEEK